MSSSGRPHASQKITQGSAACHQTFCPLLLKRKSAIDNQQQDSTCAEFRHSPSSYSSSDKCCIAHKRVITDYTLSPYSIITNVFFSNVLPLLLIWMSRCITHHVFYADIWEMYPCFKGEGTTRNRIWNWKLRVRQKEEETRNHWP